MANFSPPTHLLLPMCFFNSLIFFQFCESAPKTLGFCDLEDVRQPSYTSYQYFDKETKEKKLLNDEIYCLCPEGYNYLDTRYVFYQRAEYDVVQINSYCLPVSISNPVKELLGSTQMPKIEDTYLSQT